MYPNSITVGGRLVADVQLSKADDPAHDRVWGRVACNRQGEGCDFVPFVAWGGTARAIAEHCKKGKLLILCGSLRTRSEKKDDGTYTNYFEVNCSAVHFGPDAKNTAPSESKPATEAAATAAMPALSPEMLAALAMALRNVAPAASASPDDIPL